MRLVEQETGGRPAPPALHVAGYPKTARPRGNPARGGVRPLVAASSLLPLGRARLNSVISLKDGSRAGSERTRD